MDKYTIVRDSNAETFLKKVNEKIEEGYDPLGGVALTGNVASFFYSQALVMNDELYKKKKKADELLAAKAKLTEKAE